MYKVYLLLLSVLLNVASCNHVKTTIGSENNAFEELSKEETIAWIKEELEKGTISTSNQYSNLTLVRVAPCFIVYSYAVPALSGESMVHTVEVPTEDILIRKDGHILYTIAVVQNCTTTNDQAILVRQTIEALKIRKSGKNRYDHLTKAIQHLNGFCKKENDTDL